MRTYVHIRLRKKLIAEQGVTQNKSANLRAPSIKSNVKQRIGFIHGKWTCDESFFQKNIQNNLLLWADGPPKIKRIFDIARAI